MLLGLIKPKETRVVAALFASMIVAVAIACSDKPATTPEPAKVAPPGAVDTQPPVPPSVPEVPVLTVPEPVAPPPSANASNSASVNDFELTPARALPLGMAVTVRSCPGSRNT